MTIRLLFDEGYDKQIIAGLIKELPDLDVLRVQDADLMSQSDPDILEWAAQAGRIVVSNDRATMIEFANERLRTNKPMPGLIITRDKPIGAIVEQLAVAVSASLPDEYENRVVHLPL
ncbi:MAG: DUF5615 family PIN-like protein [Chloroflexota bacterium]|nr:DUF5615 family PIN-like protein [Chloroflexota bacterium]